MRANQIDSSDYEDGEYEEVGDDYDEDEDEEVIGVTQQPVQQFGSNTSKRRSSLLQNSMKELKENVKETDGEDEDDDYSEDEHVDKVDIHDDDDDDDEEYDKYSDDMQEDIPDVAE